MRRQQLRQPPWLRGPLRCPWLISCLCSCIVLLRWRRLVCLLLWPAAALLSLGSWPRWHGQRLHCLLQLLHRLQHFAGQRPTEHEPSQRVSPRQHQWPARVQAQAQQVAVHARCQQLVQLRAPLLPPPGVCCLNGGGADLQSPAARVA